MSQVHSQIGKIQEEIIYKLWPLFRKALNNVKNRQSTLTTLLDHKESGTFPSQFKAFEYMRQMNFPETFSQSIIATLQSQLDAKELQYKKEVLTSMIQAYKVDLEKLAEEVARFSNFDYIVELIQHNFITLSTDNGSIFTDVFQVLQYKKGRFNKPEVDAPLNHEERNRMEETFIEDDNSLDNFRLAQEDPSPFRPLKRRPQSPTESDTTIPARTAQSQTQPSDPIQTLSAQILKMQLQLDNLTTSTKNGVGPTPARGRRTDDQKDGRNNSSRDRRRSSSNNSRASWNSNRSRHFNNNQHQHRHYNINLRKSRSPSRDNKNYDNTYSHANKYQPQRSQHWQERRADNRGRGRGRGRGNQGRHF